MDEDNNLMALDLNGYKSNPGIIPPSPPPPSVCVGRRGERWGGVEGREGRIGEERLEGNYDKEGRGERGEGTKRVKRGEGTK